MKEYDEDNYYRGLAGRGPTRDMTRDETVMMMQLTRMDLADPDRRCPADYDTDLQQDPQVALMLRRLDGAAHLFGRKGWQDVTTTSLVVFAIYLDEFVGWGPPTLWAYTIALWCAERRGRASMRDVGEGMPLGLPDKGAYRGAWEDQKHTDYPDSNYLDSPEPWEILAKVYRGETEAGMRLPAAPPNLFG